MNGLEPELMALLGACLAGMKADESSLAKAEAACRDWVQQKRAVGLWPFKEEPSIRLMPAELNMLAVVWPAECFEANIATTI